jgi:hypothetical protein
LETSRRALAVELESYRAVRDAVEDASLSRKVFGDANFGVEGLDTKTVNAEGARLLRKLHGSERVFLLGLVAVQVQWGAHLDLHAAIDERTPRHRLG